MFMLWNKDLLSVLLSILLLLLLQLLLLLHPKHGRTIYFSHYNLFLKEKLSPKARVHTVRVWKTFFFFISSALS